MKISDLQLINDVANDPTSIFELINMKRFDLIKSLIDDKIVSINIVDDGGNNLIIRILKVKEYDLVSYLLNNKSLDINKSNLNGNSFLHVLVKDSNVKAIKILDSVINRSDIIVDSINNSGYTPLDIAINNNYLVIAFKILFSNKFANITIGSLIRLINTFLSPRYGVYSRISNFNTFIDGIKNINLSLEVSLFIDYLIDNVDNINLAIKTDNKKMFDGIIKMA